MRFASPLIAVVAGVLFALSDEVLLLFMGWFLFFGGLLVFVVRCYLWLSAPDNPKNKLPG